MKKNGDHQNEKNKAFRDETSLERFADKYRLKYNTLNRRERDLLKLLALEYKDAKIIEQLGISPEMLIKRKKNLKQKLSARSMADYVKYALAYGLIPF